MAISEEEARLQRSVDFWRDRSNKLEEAIRVYLSCGTFVRGDLGVLKSAVEPIRCDESDVIAGVGQ